jgi:hypothetical protein
MDRKGLYRFRLTDSRFVLDDETMDAEQTIFEIEWLERIYSVPDTRPLSLNDLTAANRRHDEVHALSPWFRLWERYGVCCRS